jgi:hypothetical protein
MKSFGGVPTEAQVDGYLNAVSASSNQKTLITNARGNHSHAMPLDKIKALLDNNS